MMRSNNALCFPRISRVTLQRFSLYSSAASVTVDMPIDGVFCLAGANGLGKSTFLAALSYGLTGIVADPARTFKSVSEYYSRGVPFADKFFTGRVAERDREAAQVTVELTVGADAYRVTRGIFEPEELRALHITRDDGEKATLLLDGAAMAPSERNLRYKEYLTRAIGLDLFEQYVFLQHFVLTFDERRHLLFWNRAELEQSLFLAFGVTYADAMRADTLRREAERADSLARNAKWQASQVRTKMRDVSAAFTHIAEAEPVPVDIADAHEALLAELDAHQAEVDLLEGQVRDAHLALATHSARQLALRNEFNAQFTEHIRASSLLQHPLIAASIATAQCGLCGTHSETLPAAIQERVEAEHCPLCGSEVDTSAHGEGIQERLRLLDYELAGASSDVEEAYAMVNRLDAQLRDSRGKLADSNARREEFERRNDEALKWLRANTSSGPRGVDAVLDVFREQLDQFERESTEQYARRDKNIAELRDVQATLEEQYAAAEHDFVPIFRDLAEHFLGMDIAIEMERGTLSKPSLGLLLQVKSSSRRETHQLSESQRFFVDIALRMSLAQYMSAGASPATLFIDTPEGSLDIAYESRAGDMFARFAKRGFRIIMTANINTSRLLLSLAEACGRARMDLHSMTSWAELSDVQIAEEQRFTHALDEIRAAMAGSAERQ